MAAFSRTRVAAAAVAMLEHYPRAEVVAALAAVLTKAGRSRDIAWLLEDMARELYYTRRHLTAEVVTATTLPPATASALKKQLKQIYAAQSVALRQTIDPDVVGGCKVRTPIGTWDATIRAGLLSLNNALRA